MLLRFFAQLPCSGQVVFGLNPTAADCPFNAQDDFAVEAAPIDFCVAFQLDVQVFGDVFDSQGWHVATSEVVPFCIHYG